jgi:glycerate-2-kinase
MQKNWIKNWDALASTTNRKLALQIANAGLEAINTEEIIANSVKLQDNILSIKESSFDLSKFKKIKVVGFGKASSDAAVALEKILGSRITQGAVVGLDKVKSNLIEIFVGTHPRPSELNVVAGERIYEIIKDSNEEDLIIVIVSGGGSALLCYSANECEQNVALYNELLKSGNTISEMNMVRKHLSILKGGGLAKIAYPATVIGLIFSDIPGDRFYDVASGPTYKDESTIADAEKVINKYNLGKFDLLETTKEDKYFDKVHNFILVSNKTAVDAMAEKSAELGFETKVVSTEMYDEVTSSLMKIFEFKKDNTVILSAGEPVLEVKKKGGSGGRNLYMGLEAIQMGLIDENSVFISIASDGMDNSDVAGSVVDLNTQEKIEKLGLNIDESLASYDVYPVFEKSGDMIVTGATGANVSDLMILLTKYEAQ